MLTPSAPYLVLPARVQVLGSHEEVGRAAHVLFSHDGPASEPERTDLSRTQVETTAVDQVLLDHLVTPTCPVSTWGWSGRG